MEKITITGLRVDTLIGVYDWEREQLTTLKLDITLTASLISAMTSDDVNDTIDYAALAEHVQKEAKNCQYELLEAFGHHIMNSILRTFPSQHVALGICKPGILADADSVTVWMERSAAE
ncbi:dihydroneopterin aldolase [Alteromonas sp. ASW11-19]|uniref:dihydroneopterin aldolase n=1 Tax=Alteromonas salexigens TaxID=2982530 RepID=A0ABT2VKV0_9ALTE|nr:dihydroneopterin aldolase [Alteromonas salexigens]MCU7553078.1 dihydroneopterin aldolase [Alteromonas salexigens]